jgi:hypothetical protein
MTSQTYNAADNHMTPENDLIGREDDRILPEDDQFTPRDDQIVPADDQIMPAQHQFASDLSEPHPAEAWVTGDLGPPAAAVPEHPGYPPVAVIAPVIDVEREPGTADTDAGNSSTSSVLAPEPEPAGAVPRVSNRAGGRWHEIQAMFVDDPRASIELAAGLVDDRVEALVGSVKDRQQALQSAWQGDNTGTEDLRVALQRYRAFWNHLEDIPA